MIEIGFKELDGRSPGCEFIVKDNGIGIAERSIDQVFLPLRRAINKSKYEGMGLHLAIVKRVLEFHGGKILVRSMLGQGTTFYFTRRKPAKAN